MGKAALPPYQPATSVPNHASCPQTWADIPASLWALLRLCRTSLQPQPYFQKRKQTRKHSSSEMVQNLDTQEKRGPQLSSDTSSAFYNKLTEGYLGYPASASVSPF